ncbi:MAG TPA: proline--tRNA ligase [Gaiellaceae bacterium]|nr:proline--tRNA ligase [Gaiellaceae bacterium]
MPVVRASQLFLPTLREDPADADAASHRLLVRGGFIRQVSAGVWTLLPLGWRVYRNIEQIVREEMDGIGAQQLLMPVLTPAELWQATGRYDIPEVFKLRDRADRPFVLPMTHEETITFHAREIRSYRDLPQMLYHIQTKDRDEPRPRAGLIRGREFVMKDSYSFDRDEEALDRSFQLHAQAYDRIFERCGLEFVAVEAESGMMGGSESRDYLAPAETGENTLVTCERGDYAADLEIARGVPRRPEFPAPLDAPDEVATPGLGTIEEVSNLLGVDPAATAKAMPHVRADGTFVLAMIRGDDRLEEAKAAGVIGGGARPATADEIRAALGADPGSVGPVGAAAEIVADEVLREGQYVVGANRDGWHLRGAEAGRDYEARFADLRQARESDTCPRCGGALRFQTAIEVGHIFKLGTFYSVPLGATFLDEDGQEKPLVMGSYGVGVTRTVAAVAEQRHDEHGLTWPPAVAPYDVHVVALPGLEEQADGVAETLASTGRAVLLDDRDQRAGEKFADADLIGCPLRITVGKRTLEDGAVDVRDRATGAERRVAAADIAEIG